MEASEVWGHLFSSCRAVRLAALAVLVLALALSTHNLPLLVIL